MSNKMYVCIVYGFSIEVLVCDVYNMCKCICRYDHVLIDNTHLTNKYVYHVSY
jgi:hypothetical protein